MIDFERTAILKNRIIDEITNMHDGLLQDFPINKYIDLCIKIPQIGGYRYVSSEVKEICKKINYKSNEQILELYHMLVLIELILLAQNELKKKKLPEDVKLLYHKNFQGIIKRIETKNENTGFYLYSNDKFCKDISVCRLWMIPCGAQKIHLGRISKKFIFKRGFQQFFRGLALLLVELGGGFKPIYRMHTDTHDRDLLAEFNPEGSLRFYLRVAEILKINKEVKGICGASWMNDPQLKNISPEIWQHNEFAYQNGGQVFYLGSNIKDIIDATYVSSKRKRLYEKGKYLPTRYLFIWSRGKLIKWANEHKKNLG
jgi:hypothetical protein